MSVNSKDPELDERMLEIAIVRDGGFVGGHLPPHRRAIFVLPPVMLLAAVSLGDRDANSRIRLQSASNAVNTVCI